MANLSIQDSPRLDISTAAPQFNNRSNLLPATKRRNELTNDTSRVNVDTRTFFIDTRGTKEPFGTNLSPPVARRSSSPEMSDSSNEMVVFSGRGRVGVNSGTNHVSSLTVENIQKCSKSPSHRPVKIIDDPVVPSALLMSTHQAHHHLPRLLPKGLDGLPDATVNSLLNAHTDSKIQRPSTNKQADEEEILADYIANINDSDEMEHMTNYDLNFIRDLEGTGDQLDDVPDENAIGNTLQSDSNWDLSDLADLEDLSTSSEDLATVGRVLSKRKRRLGVQYLVTEEGHTADDARWIPLSSLIMPGAERHISIYESKLSKSEEYLTDSEGSDDISNHQITLDLQKDINDSLNEYNLSTRRRERMTDEKIARLLSKQEELGLGSSDLLLYDGDEDGKDDHSLPLRKGAYTGALRNKGDKKSHLPSTSGFTGLLNADVFDDVDVIDQGRPTLRKKSKGRRGLPGLELTDTEIENSIQLAWENDRAKKKIRKQEREELRAQGLIGRKKADLKSKYSEDVPMAEIKNAIKQFLLSSLPR